MFGGRRSIRQRALRLASAPGREDEAVQELRLLLAGGHDRKVWRALADLLERLEHFEELEALYRERLEAGDRAVLERLGHSILGQGGRDDEAEAYLEMAVREDPEPKLALMNLGASAERNGRKEDAIRWFEQALEHGDRRAAARLASLLEGGPRDAEVDALYRRAIEAGNRTAPVYLARRLLDRGDLAELEPLYRLGLERRHGPAPAAELACVLHAHEPHREPEARELIHRALDLGIRWGLFRDVIGVRTVPRETAIWALECADRHCDAVGTDHPCASEEFRRNVLTSLMERLVAADRAAEAEAMLRERVNGREVLVLPVLAQLLERDDARRAEYREVLELGLRHDVLPTRALVALGELDEDEGRPDDALARYEDALDRGDEYYAAVRIALLLWGGDRDDEVEPLLQRATDADHPVAPRMLARRRWRAGEKEDAEALFRTAIDRRQTAAWIELALLLHVDGREEVALHAVGQAMEPGITRSDLFDAMSKFPHDDDDGVWLLRVVVRYAAHVAEDHPCATDEFRAGIMAELGYLLGRDVSTRDEARDLLVRARELGERGASVPLGMIAEDEGDLAAAEHHYAAAPEEDVWALRALARTRAALGDAGGAEEAYRRAIVLGDGEALLDLRHFLSERGERDAAFALCQEGVHRGIAEAHGALGRMLIERGHPGDDKAAFAAFRRGIAAGDSQAAQNLGYLLNERGDEDEAVAVNRAGIELGDKYCMNNLANILVRRGETAEAESLYRRSVALGCRAAEEGLAELLEAKNGGS